MEQIITLALVCTFGPVAALIGLTLFFYVLNMVDDWLTDWKYKRALKRFDERMQELKNRAVEADRMNNRPRP